MNLVKFHDRIVHMEQHFVEHIKIGMEMRRDLAERHRG